MKNKKTIRIEELVYTEKEMKLPNGEKTLIPHLGIRDYKLAISSLDKTDIIGKREQPGNVFALLGEFTKCSENFGEVNRIDYFIEKTTGSKLPPNKNKDDYIINSALRAEFIDKMCEKYTKKNSLSLKVSTLSELKTLNKYEPEKLKSDVLGVGNFTVLEEKNKKNEVLYYVLQNPDVFRSIVKHGAIIGNTKKIKELLSSEIFDENYHLAPALNITYLPNSPRKNWKDTKQISSLKSFLSGCSANDPRFENYKTVFCTLSKKQLEKINPISLIGHVISAEIQAIGNDRPWRLSETMKYITEIVMFAQEKDVFIDVFTPIDTMKIPEQLNKETKLGLEYIKNRGILHFVAYDIVNRLEKFYDAKTLISIFNGLQNSQGNSFLEAYRSQENLETFNTLLNIGYNQNSKDTMTLFNEFRKDIADKYNELLKNKQTIFGNAILPSKKPIDFCNKKLKELRQQEQLNSASLSDNITFSI